MVDGPDLRFVIFLQGYTLHYAYCHNPDTWSLTGDTEYMVDEVMQEVLQYGTYLTAPGGMTASGGEPLLQQGLTTELFRRLHREGIHAVLDTAGIDDPERARTVLLHTDFVLCDLKLSKNMNHLCCARGNVNVVPRFLQQAEELGAPLWIRHVVVPGLTDGEVHILKIAELAVWYPNLGRLELLPSRKYCIGKYETMKLEFPLRDFEECTDARTQELHRSIETGFPDGIVPLVCRWKFPTGFNGHRQKKPQVKESNFFIPGDIPLKIDGKPREVFKCFPGLLFLQQRLQSM